MAQTIEEILLKIKVQGRKDLRDVKNSIDGVGSKMTSANVKGNLYAEGIKFVVESVVKLGMALKNSAAEFQNYENQLKLITGSQVEMEQTMAMLNNAALANRASFSDTVDLYTKLTLATETMNKSQEQVVNVMGKFQKALALSGADAGTAAGAIRQFGQAMASGQVRGDEFNSIVEALGPALNIMARESGITVGELRELSQAGDLTAEAFFKMLESSNAIEIAFGQTQKTIQQLEQEVSDAASKMLASFAKESGIEEIYVGLLENLSRGMRDLAGAQTDLEKATPESLVNSQALGTASARLEELQKDFGDVISIMEKYDRQQQVVADSTQELTDITNKNSSEYYYAGQALRGAEMGLTQIEESLQDVADEMGVSIDTVREMVSNLQEQVKAQEAAAESAKKLTEAQNALQQARQRAMRGLVDELEAIDTYTKNIEKAKSPLQRNREEYAKTQQVLAELTASLGTSTEDHYDLQEAMAIVRQEQARLTGEYNDMISSFDRGSNTFEDYYEGLINSSAAAAKESVYQQQAIARLNDELAAGRINIDTYAQGMDSLGQSSDKAKEEIQTLVEFQKALTDEVNESARTQEYATESIDVYREALENVGYTTEEVAQKIQDYKDQFGLETEISSIEAFNQKWKELSNDATDEIKMAQEQASILFGGMEDAIDQLVDNGKINFGSLVDSMIKDMIRAQLKAAALNLFSGGISGGIGGALKGFGKILGFKDGGYITPGSVGLVGEEGPELISGPANITPLNNVGGGSQTINYNINAVDARSFKQMVAADPEFIHSIAMTGARNMPNRRRV